MRLSPDCWSCTQPEADSSMSRANPASAICGRAYTVHPPRIELVAPASCRSSQDTVLQAFRASYPPHSAVLLREPRAPLQRRHLASRHDAAAVHGLGCHRDPARVRVSRCVGQGERPAGAAMQATSATLLGKTLDTSLCDDSGDDKRQAFASGDTVHAGVSAHQ